VTRAPGYALFAHLWYVEAFWNAVGARGTLAVGRAVAWFDRHVVDATVDRVGRACKASGQELRRETNGQVQTYAATLMAAVVVVVVIFTLYDRGAAPAQTNPPPIPPVIADARLKPAARMQSPQMRAKTPVALPIPVPSPSVPEGSSNGSNLRNNWGGETQASAYTLFAAHGNGERGDR